MMKNFSVEPQEGGLFLSMPALTLLGVILLSNAWPSSHFQIVPDVTFAVVYYWSVFRETSPLAGTFFILGFLEDSLTGVLFGLTPLIWLTLYLLTSTQKRFLFGKNFLLIWVGFAFIAFSAYVLKWVLVSYLTENPVSFSPVLFSYFLTVALYPLLAWFLSLCNRAGYA